MCVNWTFMSQISPFPKLKRDSNWQITMNQDIKSIHKNNTWTLVPLPSCCKPISIMWVYKIKQDAKNKAQLIVWKFEQTPSFDYLHETFFLSSEMDNHQGLARNRVGPFMICMSKWHLWMETCMMLFTLNNLLDLLK
jgi:hypothetical protein